MALEDESDEGALGGKDVGVEVGAGDGTEEVGAAVAEVAMTLGSKS